MDELQILAAETALRKMVKQGHFSICTVDEILKMTGGVPDARTYQVLRLLHCVNYSEMPDELREKLPELLKAVFSGSAIDVTAILRREEAPKLAVIEGGKKVTWLHRMIGHES